MIVCSHCATPNALDGTFCKHCGRQLESADVQDALLRAEELLDNGERLFGEGRADEAMMVAESVLDENPRSVRALSLLGVCQERLGDLAGALQTYEKVLTIKPDASLEKIRVHHLRKVLSAKLAKPAPGNNRLALTGAAATLLVVAAIAIVLATSRGASDQELVASADQKPKAESPKIETFQDAQANTQQDTPNEGSPVPPRSDPDPRQTVEPAREDEGVETPAASPSGGAIPGPLDGSIPVKPTVPAEVATQLPPANQGPATQTPGRDPDPATEQDESATVQPDVEAPDNGVIEIRVHKPTPPTNGGGQPVQDSAAELQALMRAAAEQYQLGRYETAAKSYENALTVGGDPGRIGQRLGQCYEKLGRKADAIRAYERAVAAWEATLVSGSGDPTTLKRSIEACKQAIATLQDA